MVKSTLRTRRTVGSEMTASARPRSQEMCVHTVQKHDRKSLRLKKCRQRCSLKGRSLSVRFPLRNQDSENKTTSVSLGTTSHHLHCLPGAVPLNIMDDFQDAFDFDWPSQRSQRSRGTVTSYGTNASPLPPSSAPSPRPTDTPGSFSQQCHPFGTTLTFMQEADWDPEKTYDEERPTCIRYLFQWRVLRNERTVVKDEAADVVVAPECYWRRVLKAERERVLKKKIPHPRSVFPDEATVVVSVTGRSPRPLTKKFKEREIDWAIVKNKLLAWTQYFEKGGNFGCSSHTTMKPPPSRLVARRGVATREDEDRRPLVCWGRWTSSSTRNNRLRGSHRDGRKCTRSWSVPVRRAVKAPTAGLIRTGRSI
jgi:hypothetical protein